MLVIKDPEYMADVKEFADTVGMRKQLEEKLKYLDEFAEHGDRGRTQCHIRKDFAPYSFEFTMTRRRPEGEDGYDFFFVGGLVYHGKHDNGGDGSFPTLSVCLEPTNGWEVHT